MKTSNTKVHPVVTPRNHLSRPTSIPLNANTSSIHSMEQFKLDNPFNHFNKQHISWKPCKHYRVFGWKLSQCADCYQELIDRLTLEQGRANSAILEDATFTKDELADRLHGRGISIQWLLAFTHDHNCWGMPTWQVVRDIIFPACNNTGCRYADLSHMKHYIGKATFLFHIVGVACGVI